jgi:hypothetical protein
MNNPFTEGRSPHWSATRDHFLVDNPTCAGCGGRLHLNVHHKQPFHLFPALELERSNLITLCEDPARLCHYRIGHCFDWHAYNPHVVDDAALQLERIHAKKAA